MREKHPISYEIGLRPHAPKKMAIALGLFYNGFPEMITFGYRVSWKITTAVTAE